MSNLLLLDQIGESKANFTEDNFKGLAAAIVKAANLFADKMRDNFNKANAISSGEGVDSIKPLELEYDGKTFTIKIEAKDYLKFVSAGVNGVVQSRGSIYSFKNYGTPKAMVDRVEKWLIREGKMGEDKRKKPVNNKERQRQRLSLEQITRKKARSVSYMIKRQGIKPVHAIENATTEMEKIVMQHCSAALKVDIINSLT
jgi:hypothetical protein